MRDPAVGVVRATRAALLTALVVLLAASAHGLAGGHVTSPLALGVLAAAISPVAWWATRRQLGARASLALLGGGQALVHLGLVAMAPSAAGDAAATLAHDQLTHRHAAPLGGAHGLHDLAAATGHTGLAHAATTGTPAPGGLGGATHLAGSTGLADLSGALGLSASMLLTHLAATLLTAWLLAHGERLLWRAVARLLPTLLTLPTRHPHRRAPLTALLPLLSGRPAGEPTSRGPPLAAT